ncbi:DUF2076 domain-containing protein [Camelimonas lactis]|uniref:DUF2076 family protein n=1 Tax=Camelimonas lactis TaxID=659006 RepID=A0A4R2GLT4_9HYPH|nr:DUF2076 domain-containing protein [Camelimonas lactis]TCO10021.1 hypothetical protein EV666_11655 [Camelimonas lactis]
MDPQEREVIDGIFQRLQEAANNPRDPEAERYIADLVARQPHAPYALAQAVYVQDMAVQQLSSRNQELEQRVQQLEDEARRTREQLAQEQLAREQAQVQPAPNPAPAGGFLSGLFGGRGSVPPAGRPGGFGQSASPQGPGFGGARPGGPQAGPQEAGQQGSPMPGGPWSRGAQPGQGAGPWGGQQPQAPAGGGFLRGALTTAAGVAGGALLFDAVKGMMGGSSAANATPVDKAAETAKTDAQQDSNAQNSNTDDKASDQQADNSQNDNQNDASYQDAGYDDPSYDEQSWDDGGFGDDDWA